MTVPPLPVPEVLRALFLRMGRRPELHGVDLMAGPQAYTDNCVMLTGGSIDPSWDSNARRRVRYDIEFDFVVMCIRDGAVASTASTQAMERAFAIASAFQSELLGSALGHAIADIDGHPTMQEASVGPSQFGLGTLSGRRWCSVRFTVKGRTTRVTGQGMDPENS